MSKKHGLSRFGLIFACLAVVGLFAGCGSASIDLNAEEPTQQSDKKHDSPFGDSADLRGGGGEDDVEYDEDDLEVPGSQFGIQGGAGAKQCPAGKKGKKCRKNNAGKIPHSDAIAEQMEGLAWGMHYKTVIDIFKGKVKESYAEELKSAGGAVEEDAVRSKMLRDLNKFKKSYVEFDGQRTGFEGTFTDREFTHNNDESMLEWDAGKYVEYLFFIRGRFWKRVRAFRKDSFSSDITFDLYTSTLINRFGDGLEVIDDRGNLAELKWQDDETYMVARDDSNFFGVYTLSFMARVTEDNIDKLRVNADRKKGTVDSDVSSMIESATSGSLSDHNTSVIDSYTGSDHGGPKGGQVESHHSVIGGKQDEKEKKKEKEKEEEESEPIDDDSLDDLF